MTMVNNRNTLHSKNVPLVKRDGKVKNLDCSL